MKIKIKELYGLLKEVFLLIIGSIVFLSLFLVGLVYSFVKHTLKLDYSLSKQLTPIVRSVTLLINGLANSGAGELLNDILKVNGLIKYGKWYQSISSVTGLRLKYENQDNNFRKFVDFVLGKNHCIEAIREEEDYYYSNKLKND